MQTEASTAILLIIIFCTYFLWNWSRWDSWDWGLELKVLLSVRRRRSAVGIAS